MSDSPRETDTHAKAGKNPRETKTTHTPAVYDKQRFCRFADTKTTDNKQSNLLQKDGNLEPGTSTKPYGWQQQHMQSMTDNDTNTQSFWIAASTNVASPLLQTTHQKMQLATC